MVEIKGRVVRLGGNFRFAFDRPINQAKIEQVAANDYLPLPEEQQWLLDELAGLASACGIAPLLRSHILLPTAEYFPDPWTPDVRGVSRLCRRLLLYAGLGQLRVQVETYTNPSEPVIGPGLLDGSERQHRIEGAAGWFSGIHDGCCSFGVDTNQLAESAAVVGTMCHEVAHAFRAHHQLVHPDRQLDELLTDLTTIFLGFGVLTANGAYLHRTFGGADGELGVYRVRTSQAGYLLPEAMCFLLAAQAVVRQCPGPELRKIHRALETNQEAYFKAAYKALAGEAVGLAQRLKVPAPEQWPPPIRLGRLTRPLADPKEPKGRLLPRVPAPSPRTNTGLPVFRVRSQRADFRLVTLLVVFGGAALLTGGTGGAVAGEIRYPSERLAAREALLGAPEESELPWQLEEPVETPPTEPPAD